jgi:imidazole glycerol phosphate synthase subunit HisF
MGGKIGEIDGKLPVERALNAIAGYYDMYPIAVSSSATEDIDLEVAIGSGVIGVDVMDTTGTAGNVLIKTVNNEYGDYVTVPVAASSRIGVLPRFQHIKKTGTVNSIIVFYQKVNQ